MQEKLCHRRGQRHYVAEAKLSIHGDFSKLLSKRKDHFVATCQGGHGNHQKVDSISQVGIIYNQAIFNQTYIKRFSYLDIINLLTYIKHIIWLISNFFHIIKKCWSPFRNHQMFIYIIQWTMFLEGQFLL